MDGKPIEIQRNPKASLFKEWFSIIFSSEQILKGENDGKTGLSSDPTVWLDRIAVIFK